MGIEATKKVILAEMKVTINLQDTELIENHATSIMVTEGEDPMISEVTEETMETEGN